MSSQPPPPLPGPADDRLVPRSLTAADWRAWADSAIVDLQGAWTFALHCPADPDLRGHVAKVLRSLDSVSALLRNTLVVMSDAAHDPSPDDPSTSRPFTPPR